MANTKSARRAQEQSERRRIFNLRRKRTMKAAVKDLQTLVSSGKKDEAQKAMPGVYKAIDKAVKRGVIKDNTASRKKSRLSASVKAL